MEYKITGQLTVTKPSQQHGWSFSLLILLNFIHKRSNSSSDREMLRRFPHELYADWKDKGLVFFSICVAIVFPQK